MFLKEKTEEVAREVAVREGCYLYDLEWIALGNPKILRVFIDKKGMQVSIEDCSNVSKGISLALDLENLVEADQYDLEVSSPGVEKSLKKFEHFENALQALVQLKLKESVQVPLKNGQSVPAKNIKGRLLLAPTLDDIQVEVDGMKVSLSYNNIEKAQTLFEETKKERPGKRG